MGRFVVLRHDLPDGSHHLDWFIDPHDRPAPEDPDERSLAAWRLEAPLSACIGRTVTATRLPPHRRLYLTYEGEVSRGRGRVRRIETGRCTIQTDDARRFLAEGVLAGRPFRVEGSPTAADAWALALTDA